MSNLNWDEFKPDLTEGWANLTEEEKNKILISTGLTQEQARSILRPSADCAVLPDHVPPSYSPYIKKRRKSKNDATPQVPNKVQSPKPIPEWNPPEPTPPPPTQTEPQPSPLLPTPFPLLPTPSLLLPNPSPLLPTPSPLLPTSTQLHTPHQPLRTTHNIPPVMSITFTPHIIRQFQSRLHKLHSPRYHSQPHPTFITPIIPLLHTISHLVTTLHHIAATLQTCTLPPQHYTRP